MGHVQIPRGVKDFKHIRLDGADVRPLVDQVVDCLARSMAQGDFKVGDALPNRRLLAEKLGVGECTVRAALARLAAQGLVLSRPRLGCVVLEPRRITLPKVVLDLSVGDCCCYSSNMLSRAFCSELSRAGCLGRSVAVESCKKGHPDRTMIRQCLAERPDFVLVRGPASFIADAAALVARSGVPFAMVFGGGSRHANCVGNVTFDASQAVADFVRDCRQANVSSVLQLDYGEDTYIDASSRLRASGISVERLGMPNRLQCVNLDSQAKEAAQLLCARLKKGNLPDLIFITDDFLAAGALSVIQAQGFRIPDDFSVVSYVNVGSGFYYPQPFACIEFDPAEDGRSIARCVLEWFRAGTFPADYSSCPTYCRGATFPVF